MVLMDQLQTDGLAQVLAQRVHTVMELLQVEVDLVAKALVLVEKTKHHLEVT
jgi:hypothetical protein